MPLMHRAGRSGLDGRRSSVRSVPLFAVGDRQSGRVGGCPVRRRSPPPGMADSARRTCRLTLQSIAGSRGLAPAGLLRSWFRPICPARLVQGDARITSHFGNGIITFSIPVSVSHAARHQPLGQGSDQLFKDGIQPLEGVVETDWLGATFTMNWKLTRRYHAVRFERGEPICMVVPIPRGLAEHWSRLYCRSTPTRNWPANIASGKVRAPASTPIWRVSSTSGETRLAARLHAGIDAQRLSCKSIRRA